MVIKLSVSVPDELFHTAQAVTNEDSPSKLVQLALKALIRSNVTYEDSTSFS